MATVFETRLIGNIGKDAVVKTMDKGVVAVNFPVAHNKNWKDKRTGEQRTKTTWVNCTIWKRDGANMRILDFLTKGTLVEIVGTPFAKGYLQDDQSIKTEIRLNVSKTNILRPAKSDDNQS
jgi:single-strand DNA-binding protein